jgi:predicted phosphodiesterase
MASVVRNWKKFMVVGCSHATHADPVAINAIIKAKKSFKPDRFIHAGDFTDTLAWMGSNKDSEGEPVNEDISIGLQHLAQLGITDALAGNHEARLWKYVNSSNQVKAYASFQAINALETGIKKIGANFIKYEGVYSTLQLGNGIITHGTIFNENSSRDMAEMYCKNGVSIVISAHTHRCAYAKGRRDDNPTGVNVGTLTKEMALDYANTRRATLGWSQGFAWGEFCDDRMVVWLHEHPRNQNEWKLPI